MIRIVESGKLSIISLIADRDYEKFKAFSIDGKLSMDMTVDIPIFRISSASASTAQAVTYKDKSGKIGITITNRMQIRDLGKYVEASDGQQRLLLFKF